MQRFLPTLTAVAVAVIALAACRIVLPLNMSSNELLPVMASVHTIGLVATAEHEAEITRLLKEAGLHVRTLGSSYAMVFSGGLGDTLDAEAPRPWPNEARAAWLEGSSACRAHAGREPWRHNPVADACARGLSWLLWEQLILGERLDAVMVVLPEPENMGDDNDAMEGTFYAPGSVRAVFRRSGMSSADVADATRWFLAGNHTIVGRRQPIFSMPTFPVDNDPLFDGPDMDITARRVPHCSHTLPSSIHVSAARGDATPSLARMLEKGWNSIPAEQRQGPAAACRVSASSWRDHTGVVLGAGWLDCGKDAAMVTALVNPAGNRATIGLANALMSRVVFDTCQRGP